MSEVRPTPAGLAANFQEKFGNPTEDQPGGEAGQKPTETGGTGNPPADPNPTNPPADQGFDFEKNRGDIERYLSERTKGRIKSVDDLDNLPEPVTFANDRLREANEYALRNNGDETDFYKSQSTDWTKVEDLDILRNVLKRDKPHFSEEEIELLLQKTYQLNEDEYSEFQRKTGQLQMKEDAKKYRDELIADQEKLKVPPAERKAAEDEKTLQDALNQWTKTVDNALSGFKGLELKLDAEGKRSFTYGFKDDTARNKAVNQVRNALTNLDDAGVLALMNSKRYQGEAGLKTLAEDIFFLENRDQIIAALALNETSQAIEDYRKGKLSFPNGYGNRAGSTGGATDMYSSIRQQKAARNGR